MQPIRNLKWRIAYTRGCPCTLALDEIKNLSEAVRVAVHPDSNIIIGMRRDGMMGDNMQALIIAT